MASPQARKEAARADVRETMAVLTSGARQKVDTALAGASAVGQQVLHPFDKDARVQAQDTLEEKKKAAVDKRDSIRIIASQQAGQAKLAASGVQPQGMGEGGLNYPSTQPAVQQTSQEPLGTQDKADQPTSENHHPTLGELLEAEAPKDNLHTQNVEDTGDSKPRVAQTTETGLQPEAPENNSHARDFEETDDSKPRLAQNTAPEADNNVVPGEKVDENVAPEGKRDVPVVEEGRPISEGESDAPIQSRNENLSHEVNRKTESVNEEKPPSD